MTTPNKSIPEIVSALRQGLAGRIILPSDANYDETRIVASGAIDRHPAIIVRPANADDVAKVVSVARDTGIEFAVRSGGHSGAGHSTTEGGLVLDLRDMKNIEIDATTKTGWADAGVTAGEFTVAATGENLVVPFGDTGSVGIGGITLGGGVGYLVRKLGLTIDSLLGAEIVTADGKLITADATTNPDLFWALRGGGGNFGVVTRFNFRLHDLPAFTGGMIALPATPETVAGFIAAAQAAGDEVSTIANVMTAPPMPFLPADVVGKTIIMGMLAYAGEPKDAEKALAPFRALAKPYADFVKPGPYTSMFPPEDPNYRPTAAAKTLFIKDFDKSTAKNIVETLEASDAVFRVVQLRVLGGAYSRVASDATAYAHRSAEIMANVAAFYTTPEDRKVREAWVDTFTADLRGGDSTAYSNFINAEGADRVRDAYPGQTWDRLREVKRKYDPQNLFRLNHNIAP